MKSSDLRRLIRETVVRKMNEIEGGPGGIDRPHEPMIPPGAKLLITPGSPFVDGSGVTNLGILPNEARALLMKWAHFAKAAWAKYGRPEGWPMDVRQAAERLGNDFQHRMGVKQPGTDNQPRRDNPVSGMAF